jgi:hypothetical protein
MTNAMNINTLKGKILLMAVLLAIMAAAMLSLNVKKAEAYTVSTSGYAGGVSFNKTDGYAATPSSLHPHFATNAISASRSLAYSGTQMITIRYRVFYWDGSGQRWVSWDQRQTSANVPYGYKMSTSGWNIPVDVSTYNSADITVLWQKTDGTVLGRRYIDLSQTGDYRCMSSNCNISTMPSYGGAGMSLSYQF